MNDELVDAVMAEVSTLSALEREAGKSHERGDDRRSSTYGSRAAESVDRIENIIRTLDPR